MTARTLMVQGTASSVGKSIVVAGLCRLFVRAGLRVAPFKSQNMALNAYVTPDGREIGRAQAVQAEAARIAPSVDMNPILLKPEGEARCQVVVNGKPTGTTRAAEYQDRKLALRGVVSDALERLRAAYDLVVIEGAGSPAEINLKERDIVNMFVAELADAPVLLVGDIDRGGVFAAFVGTLELLEPHERARVAAFVVNKFRGDVSLLEPGLRYLEQRTSIPVLGVLPYLHQLRIADEDSLGLEARRGRRRAGATEIEIAVVCVPRISNYDDFQPLEHEPSVVVRFVEQADALDGADLVILPGTKSTMLDLEWLKQTGFARALAARAARGDPILGICGGCQMLGRAIFDPEHVESQRSSCDGLGLLPLTTHFGPEKRTRRVEAEVAHSALGWTKGLGSLLGYEIHMGRVEREAGAAPAFHIHSRNGRAESAGDGALSSNGAVMGTMIHGLFENQPLRRSLIEALCRRKGIAPPAIESSPRALPDEYDRLADAIRSHIDLELLYRLIDRPARRGSS